MTGPCTDYHVDTAAFPHPDHSGCRAICHGFIPATHVRNSVEYVLDTDHNQMSTESLTHVAAALNIYGSGARNLRLKIRSALRKYSDALPLANIKCTVAELFDSFEKPRKPAPLSIAALHCIEMPGKLTIEFLRTQITLHISLGNVHNFLILIKTHCLMLRMSLVV